MIQIGIDDISFYTSHFYLDLHLLAEKRNSDYNKYFTGIGIEKIGIPAPDEDIVTMGANAALPILKNCDKSTVGTLLLATETGIDQSKSAAAFLVELLQLNSNCRIAEIKQACYASTAAIQMAIGLVARNSEKSVLVISSDIARYGLDSPGESTQGCGAVAMIIKKNPKIMEIYPESGCFSANVWDFWRPNYSSEPFVDGKFSIINYIRTAKESWKILEKESGLKFDDVFRFCYHLPFSTMGFKAHFKLGKETGSSKNQTELEKQLYPSTLYSRQIGNCYSASLYLSFCSLIDNEKEDLSGKTIALFGYGSGCAGEFFYGKIISSYKDMLRTVENHQMLDKREAIDFQKYLEYHNYSDSMKFMDGNYEQPKVTHGAFRFCGIKNHSRIYEKCVTQCQ